MATKVQQAPDRVISCSFADSGPGLISDDFVQLILGAGMSVKQEYSSLVLTMGTTPNSEFLARTKASVSGAYTARWREMMSQRIANNVMSVELADLVGSNLAYAVDATGLLITVRIPEHTFTSTSVGQFVSLGAITGAAVAMPGRYAITAVSGEFVTFSPVTPCTWARSTTTATITTLSTTLMAFAAQSTATVSASSDVAAIVNGVVTLATQTASAGAGAVYTFTCLNAGATSGTLTLTLTSAAWTPSATGTLTVYGWNAHGIVYNSITATNGWYDTVRKGWCLGGTIATVQSTTTGQVTQLQSDVIYADISTAAIGSGTTYKFTSRADRTENMPPEDADLYFFIRAFNGPVAPATTTTCTWGFVAIEEDTNSKTFIAGATQNGANRAMSVNVQALPATTATSTQALSATASGASTFHHAISAASTNATSVKTSAGAISLITVTNSNAAVRYFKLYNKASAPTVGTDTPILTAAIPPNDTWTLPYGALFDRLATGIAYALTTGAAVADTGAVGLNEHAVHISYA